MKVVKFPNFVSNGMIRTRTNLSNKDIIHPIGMDYRSYLIECKKDEMTRLGKSADDYITTCITDNYRCYPSLYFQLKRIFSNKR